MSETLTDGGSGGPLSQVDTYSGKLYWLNSLPGKDLDLDSLRNELSNRTFQEDVSEDFDEDDVIIPDVFEQEGKIVRTTTTNDVEFVSYDGREVIVGEVILDNIDRVTYRDSEILMMDTTRAKFVIFQKGEFHYLAILARRELAETIVSIFRNGFSEFGSLINLTRLSSDAIQRIREALNATLMDTIITDYDQSEITQTRIQGRSYEETDVYDRLGTGGQVKSHLFQTEEIVPDDPITVLIGRDGLARIYSNSSLQTYIHLLDEYIIPEIHRDAESSPSVGAWESVSSDDEVSIFKDE